MQAHLSASVLARLQLNQTRLLLNQSGFTPQQPPDTSMLDWKEGGPCSSHTPSNEGYLLGHTQES